MPTSQLGRRNYISAVGGSLATASVIGTPALASTADQVTVTGKLESHDGDPIVGRKVYYRNNGSRVLLETDTSGVFETKADTDSHVKLGFYKSGNGQRHAPVKNGVPHIDGLGTYKIKNSDTDLGTFSLEQGYLVNLRAVDEDGNPVTDAGFEFGADGYRSSNYNNILSANNAGYLIISSADFTGVELTEAVNVTIKIPTDGDGVTKYKESLYVKSPMTVIAQQGEGTTIKENKPTKTTETTTTTQTTTTTEPTTIETTTSVSATSETTSQSTEMGMSANDTETQSKRGFLSNGESAGDYEFLTNPFHLTVGGFVLSVAGIAHNLLWGR